MFNPIGLKVLAGQVEEKKPYLVDISPRTCAVGLAMIILGGCVGVLSILQMASQNGLFDRAIGK